MVGPLLRITTTPAQYEYQVTRAKLEISQSVPEVDRTTQRASLNMRLQSGRLEMDSVRRRSDMGFKGVVDQADFDANLGREAAMESTRNYAEMGSQMANIAKGGNIPDTLWGKSMQHSKGDLVLMPVSPVSIRFIPSSLQTNYQPGQMSANWNIGRAKLDFVPGSFSLNFTQYNSVHIEYLGGPNYVPPSADPNFVAKA